MRRRRQVPRRRRSAVQPEDRDGDDSREVERVGCVKGQVASGQGQGDLLVDARAVPAHELEHPVRDQAEGDAEQEAAQRQLEHVGDDVAEDRPAHGRAAAVLAVVLSDPPVVAQHVRQEDREERERRRVVEQRLALQQDAEPARPSALLHHVDDRDSVCRREHRAQERDVLPAPASVGEPEHVEQQRYHGSGREADDEEGRRQHLQQRALEQEIVDPRARVEQQRREENVEEELVRHDRQKPADRVAQAAQRPAWDDGERLERGAGEQEHRGAELAAQDAGGDDGEADKEDRVLARLRHGAVVVVV